MKKNILSIVLILFAHLFLYVPEAFATTANFTYTGGQQTWVVPSGVTSIDVDIQGAAGGNSAVQLAAVGKGGRVQGTLVVTPGETLYIYVGQKPTSGTSFGAFGGGGASGNSYWSYSGGGGGGASDIRQGGNALSNRKGVAGGGGGAGGEALPGNVYGGTGGAGGDSTNGGSGGQGASNGGHGGSGAASSSGGAGGTGGTGIDGIAGTLGLGGVGGGIPYPWVSPYGDSAGGGGGGGGGYYGGGGGEGAPATGSTTATDSGAGGGAGGTNYSGGLTSVTSTQGYSGATGNGQVTFTYTAVVNPSSGACASVPQIGDYVVSTSCHFAGSPYDGVDAGTGITNTAKITINSGTSLTIGMNQTIASGSLVQNSGGGIVKFTGGVLQTGPLWIPDTDGDTYPDSATTSGQMYSATQPSHFVRRDTTTPVDCAISDGTKWQFLSGYPDTDNDGYGAGSTTSQACSGASLPSGYSLNNTDCAPTDATKFKYTVLKIGKRPIPMCYK